MKFSFLNFFQWLKLFINIVFISTHYSEAGWTKLSTSGIYVFRVGILALHKALSDRLRDPLAVAAFSLAVHNGGNLLEAINITGMINKPHDARFPELLDPSGLDAEALEAEILDLAESVRGTILQMTNEYFVSQAMADYPQAPRSNLVSIFFLDFYVYLRTMLSSYSSRWITLDISNFY